MRAPAIGIRLAALMLAWLAGVAVQLQERSLQSPSFYVAVAAAGMVALIAGFAWRRRGLAATILASTGALLAGFALTGGQASLRLGDALPSALEGRDLLGVARSLDRSIPDGCDAGIPLRGRPALHWDGAGSRSCVWPRGLRLQPRERAVVIRVGKGRSVLLTGDIEREQEALLVVEHGGGLPSDVLIAPHHGSKTSSSAALLDAVRPSLVVVQAGYRNRFGHPAAEVLGRYASAASGSSTARRAAPGPGPPRRQSTTPPASARLRAATGAPMRPCWRRDRRRQGVSSAIFVVGRAIPDLSV
jgi:hypothetical protein